MNFNMIAPFSSTITASTNYAASSNQRSLLLFPSLYSPISQHFCHSDGYTFPPLPPSYRFQPNESYVPQQAYRVLPTVSLNSFTRSNHVNISLDNQLNVDFSRTQNSSAVLPTINLSQTLHSSSASKAARMRRKMAMKRKSSTSTRRCSSSSTTRFNKRASLINTEVNIYNFSSPCGKKLKFIFEKVLTKSDVGSDGRIILPKKPSVENLSALGDDGNGIHISVQDIDSPITWHMRYGFWINNGRNVYILKNTGKYVKHHGLKTGDSVNLYIDELNMLYISCNKAEPSLNAEQRDDMYPVAGPTLDVEGPDAEQHDDVYPVAGPSLNVEGPDAKQHDDVYPGAADGDCNLPDFASFSDFDDFSWFDCDNQSW